MQDTGKYTPRDFDVPYDMSGDPAVMRAMVNAMRLDTSVNPASAVAVIAENTMEPAHLHNHDRIKMLRKVLRVDSFTATSLLHWIMFDTWLHPQPRKSIHDDVQIIIQPPCVYRAVVVFPPGFEMEATIWRRYASVPWFLGVPTAAGTQLWTVTDTGMCEITEQTWTLFMHKFVFTVTESMNVSSRSKFLSMMLCAQDQTIKLTTAMLNMRISHEACTCQTCIAPMLPVAHFPQLQLQRGASDTVSKLSQPYVVDAYVLPAYAFTHKHVTLCSAHVTAGVAAELPGTVDFVNAHTPAHVSE